MRLKSRVILKEYGKDSCYLVDLESEEETFFKCEDATAVMMKFIYKKPEFSQLQLIEILKSEYDGVTIETLSSDVQKFIDFLKEKDFVAE